MRLRDFWLKATDEQRKALVQMVGTTEGYILKINSINKAANLFAYKIELATRKLANEDKRLGTVPALSLARDPKAYKTFLKQIGVAK